MQNGPAAITLLGIWAFGHFPLAVIASKPTGPDLIYEAAFCLVSICIRSKERSKFLAMKCGTAITLTLSSEANSYVKS